MLKACSGKSCAVVDSIKLAAIDAAEEIARADPGVANHVYAALAQPLPVYLHEDRRLDALLKIAMHNKLETPCARTLELFEPFVPWRRDVLEWRAQCYARSGDARKGAAVADVAAFDSQGPAAFEAGLSTTPSP